MIEVRTQDTAFPLSMPLRERRSGESVCAKEYRRPMRLAPYLLSPRLVGLISCGGGDHPPSPTGGETTPLHLEIASGNSQEADPGSQLPMPVRVRVANASNVARPNVRVTFTVGSGGGSIAEVANPAEHLQVLLFTGIDRTASIRWRLGSDTMSLQTINVAATGVATPVSGAAAGDTEGSLRQYRAGRGHCDGDWRYRCGHHLAW